MLAALSRETGDIDWEADLGGSVGAPLVEGNTIVVRRLIEDNTNYQESQVTLHGLDAETGEERWTALTMTAGYAGGFHPILTTQEFVLVREAIDVVPNVQPMHAVSLADGTTKWTVDVGSHRGTHVRDGTVYYAGHTGVTAFEFDGSRRWEWSHDISSYDALGGTALVCDHVVIHGSDDGAIHGVGIESGESQWTFAPSHSFGRLYDYRGRLFVADENQARVNPTNGEPVWTRDEHRDRLSAGYGMLFGTKYDDPTITARAISDGTISWDQQVDGGARLAGVAHGQLFIIRPADDSLDGPSYIGALNAATGEQIWKLEAERGFDWHDAMIGTERVYVPDQTRPRTEQDDTHGNLRAIKI
jgi:outer membrane protein assembly factor BamB